MTTAATRRESELEAALAAANARIDRLETEVAALREIERRIEALEQSRPDRDRAAADLRFALAQLIPDAEGLTLSASDVIDRAESSDELRRAIDAAMIEGAGELGCWLRQHQGIKNGIAIDRRGRRWHISTYVRG